MKLSKIINRETQRSLTIDVRPSYTVVQIFEKNKSNSTLKVYKKVEIDIDIPEVSTSNVAHLGVKWYHHLVEPNFYINLYYYEN